MINRSVFTDIMFEAVKESIMGMSLNPEFLGAEPGILSVLHTWGSALPLHPHIHSLITDGGLNENGEWIKAKGKRIVRNHGIFSNNNKEYTKFLRLGQSP